MSVARIESSDRLQVVQQEKIVPVYDLRAIQARNACPQLEAPYKALVQIRRDNPFFLQGMDCQTLAYSLYTLNPNETEKIVQIFKTDRKTLSRWFSELIETVTDEEWTQFEETVDALEEQKRDTRYISTPLWQSSDTFVTSLLSPLGPGLKQLVHAALTSNSYHEIQEKTGHTYKGSRQRLSDARKILEPQLIPEGYVRLGKTDTEILSVSMGRIPFLKIGSIIYVKKADLNGVINTVTPQSTPIPESIPEFKRERVIRPAPFKPRRKNK